MKLPSSISERQGIKKAWAPTLPLSNKIIFVLGCAMAAFLIRFFLVSQYSVIEWDGVYYANLGERIISGDFYGGISAYWSPLYCFFIGISYPFFQNSESAGRFVSIIAGVLLIFPVYFLIRDFFGQLPAYFGTILVVIHPMLIVSSLWVMTESVYTLIFTTIMLTGWHALRKGKARVFFLTGLLFGAAYLVKPEAIGFVGLFFVLTLGAKFFRSNLTFRTLLKGYSLLLLGFAIFFLPYAGFLHQKTGRWTISQKLQNNVAVINESEGEGLRKFTDDRQTTKLDQLFGDVYETGQPKKPFLLVSSSLDSLHTSSDIQRGSGIKRHLVRIFYNLKKEVKQYILQELFPFFYLFIPIAIIGFFYKPWTRLRTAKEIYLFSFFIFTLFGYAASVMGMRYLIPIIPILTCWIAQGIFGFSDWATKSSSRFLRTNHKFKPIFAQVFTLIILIASMIFSLSQMISLDNVKDIPFEEKQAGLWIKNQTKSQPLIMASAPIVAYYAGAKQIYLPDEESFEVLDYAKRKKVNYLIVSSRRKHETPNAFPPDEQSFPEEFKLVYKDEQYPGYEILVYQLAN
jgi:4-amino-4-deoxy-L-arabinose transferase-like glycosyltransferase